ncbi:MAG: DUF4097 family beta strand repeat-containing protein [Phycisphaerae bacterium]|nr:DUF4097 family beta strand repeat-containing protein [Phycisphaerae bacterium]
MSMASLFTHSLGRPALAALALSSIALAGCFPLDGKASRTLSTVEAKPQAITISSQFCDVELTVSTGETVNVDAEVILETSGGNETAEREIELVKVNVVREGNTLIVRQGDPARTRSFTGTTSGSGHIRVALPAGVPFVISTASGAAKISGDFGAVEARITSASGDIGGTFGAKTLTTKTSSGDVDITLLAPVDTFEWSGASGSLHVKGTIGDAKLSAASGSITAFGLTGSCDVDVASGDVHLIFAKFDGATNISARSASGSVWMEVPAGTAPAGTVSTASGDVKVELPFLAKSRGGTLTGTEGTLTVTTASGDITLRTKK